jgi:hypothetical protein
VLHLVAYSRVAPSARRYTTPAKPTALDHLDDKLGRLIARAKGN